jgi:membrane associated rhomboid family serine protease
MIQSVFDQFGLSPGPLQLFSLSWWGIDNLYLWQPLTFLFVQTYSSSGITFFSLITLFFLMYMLWTLGTAIYELVGKGSFLQFYFVCGIAAGISALLIMPITGKYAMLAGSTPAILALLTAWSMAYPDTEVLLFFLIPIKAKWIMSGLAGAILLITLSQWDIASFFLYLSAIIFGYVYACFGWGWHSPFPLTNSIDSALAALGLKLRRYNVIPKWLNFNKNKTSSSSPTAQEKVLDINTGAPPSNDDIFIDNMLAKISKDGEHSLSWSERRRMQHISERKREEQSGQKPPK